MCSIVDTKISVLHVAHTGVLGRCKVRLETWDSDDAAVVRSSV